MPGSTGPHLGLVWGYSPGENGWGVGGFNPNFARLDALTQLSVAEVLSTPPGTPANGDTYIVGASPTGAWAGHDDDVAVWYTIGTPAWLFLPPAEGHRAYNAATETYWTYDGSAWVEELPVAGPASAIDGNFPMFDGPTGKALADSGKAAPIGDVVGTDDIQTLVNKTIDGDDNTLVVHLDADVTGNLPVTNLNSGTGASSTTAWFGDGTWKTVAAGGTGDVVGPAGAITGNIPGYADATGKVLNDTGIPAADVLLAGGALVAGNFLTVDGGGDVVDSGVSGVGTGDVVGPAGSTTGNLPSYADATGKLLNDSGVPVADVLLVGGALAAGNLLTVNSGGDVVDTGLPAATRTVPAGTANYDQLVWDGSAWTVQRAKYIIGFDIPGVLTLGRVFSHVFTKACTVPSNFGAYLGHSSQARGSANATSSPVVTAAKATAGSPLSFSNVGTVTITAGGVVPVFATSGGALSFAQGDTIRFTVTTGDTTFADMILTIVGFET